MKGKGAFGEKKWRSLWLFLIDSKIWGGGKETKNGVKETHSGLEPLDP